MKTGNAYLIKVQDELDCYRRHLLFGAELTPAQQEVFGKIDTARAWLKEGYADSAVVKLLRNDPLTKLNERRAREVLVMAYDLFADLRQARSPEGVKYLYAETLREAATLLKKQADLAFREGEREVGAKLMKEWRAMMTEAAKLDGAYQEAKADLAGRKKPMKVVLRRVTTVTEAGTTDTLTEEAEYEHLDD